MVKKSKLVLTLTIALLICFAGISTVLAASTPDEPAEAAITKILKVPIGTTLPTGLEFRFEVEKVSYNGNNTAPVTATMPALGTSGIITIPVTGSGDDDGGITTYILESGNIVGISWPNTGVYKYSITEVPNTYSANLDPDVLEALTYSGAEYELNVHVKQGVNSLAQTVFYVDYVEGVVVTPDDYDEENEGGEKVTVTPGGDGDELEFSQIFFVNTYEKTNVITNPITETGPLSVSKAVAGTYASTSQYFEYTGTVTSLFSDSASYKAYIVSGSSVVSLTASGNPNTRSGNDATGDYITFASGTGVQFYLKDGEKLVFLNAPVGAEFTVVETAAAGYTPSIAVNGSTLSDELSTDVQYVSESGSIAAYTNTNDGITPTGLNLSDLPFIGLIVLAVGALVIFIVVKSRKKRSYN